MTVHSSENPTHGRALMDVSTALDIESLVGHEEKMKELMHWPNSVVRFFAPVPLQYHLYKNPYREISVLQNIFENTNDLEVQYWICFSLFSVSMNYLLRNKDAPGLLFDYLDAYFIEFWNDRYKDQNYSSEKIELLSKGPSMLYASFRGKTPITQYAL